MTDTELDDTDDDYDDEVEEPGPAEETATVTIKGTGISITRSVDEATMSAIIALLFGGPGALQSGGGTLRQPAQPHQPQSSGGGGGTAPMWDPDLTLGEFIAETEARTFQQKICAAGYYLIKFDGKDSFDRDGIKAALVAAHEDLPGNYGRDFTAAASSKLIAAKPGESGQYFVTTTGRRAVESHFQDVPKRRAQRRRRATQSASDGDGE